MSSSQREEEGRALMAAAEKKAEHKPGFFRSMFGSSGGEEEAADMYVKAANSFKLAKAWGLAGEAFEKAAKAFESSSSSLSYEAASKYADAAKAYKNGPQERAVPAYNNAIRLYTDAGRFQQCARLSKELAELHDANDDKEKAIAAYKSAADFYDGEDAKSNANSMRAKVAMLTGTLGNYAEAAELYEGIASDALQSNMLKYMARDHLLRAGICRLCIGDAVGSRRALEQYGSMDATFVESREGKLLEAIVTSAEEGNVEAFTDALYNYDSISKLDDWKTSMLLKVKNSIKDMDDDLT